MTRLQIKQNRSEAKRGAGTYFAHHPSGNELRSAGREAGGVHGTVVGGAPPGRRGALRRIALPLWVWKLDKSVQQRHTTQEGAAHSRGPDPRVLVEPSSLSRRFYALRNESVLDVKWHNSGEVKLKLSLRFWLSRSLCAFKVNLTVTHECELNLEALLARSNSGRTAAC